MRILRTSALVWLLGLAAWAGSIALFHADQVESHDLTRALHPGFDAFGRDCLELTLIAAWQSFSLLLPMSMVLIAVALLLVFVRFLGGKRLDFIFRSALDTISSLPGLLIALALSAFFEEQRWGFVIACAISVVPYLIRFYEGQVTDLQARTYYQSTVAIGASPAHLYRRYIIPELLTGTTSIFPFLMTRLILIETSLSFLGLQSFSTGETWGRLLYQGKDYLLEAPWIIAAVGTPLFLTLLAFHLLSDPERT
jgi:peptide/nickel transport system permease protein